MKNIIVVFLITIVAIKQSVAAKNTDGHENFFSESYKPYITIEQLIRNHGDTHEIRNALDGALSADQAKRLSANPVPTTGDQVSGVLQAVALLLDVIGEKKEKNKADIYQCIRTGSTGEVEDYTDTVKIKFTKQKCYIEMNDGKEIERTADGTGYFGIEAKDNNLTLHDTRFTLSLPFYEIVGKTFFECKQQ